MSKKNNDLKKHYLDAVNQIDNESRDSYIDRYIGVLRDLFTNIGTDRVIIRNNWWINKDAMTINDAMEWIDKHWYSLIEQNKIKIINKIIYQLTSKKED